MARMSRAESQAQTRSQLVATARQMFFDDGYHPTSLEKVADTAGYSKGAVYSNFRNKDELCAAVLDEVRAERFAETIELVAQPDRFEALRDWAERVIGDPGWTPLEAEFALHARTDEGSAHRTRRPPGQHHRNARQRRHGIRRRSRPQDAQPRSGHRHARPRGRTRLDAIDRSVHPCERARRHAPAGGRATLLAIAPFWHAGCHD